MLPLRWRRGRGWFRKLYLLWWTPVSLFAIWAAVRSVDAVHALLGGDVGTLGILVALVQRKPLFVRYCGLWGKPETLAQHFWHWLLVRIAGGRNVVLATGGGDAPPSARNPAIRWIFSTSMRKAEMESLPRGSPWKPGEPLRLITVGWLRPDKNVDCVIRALALVRAHCPSVMLDVVGDGDCRQGLERLAGDLGLGDAVVFRGALSHDGVIDALCHAHILCFPTRSEGFPKAVVEAMACGLPVITTRVSVLSHLIGDRNGVLLNDAQPAAMAQAILDLISDEHRYAQMAVSAQETARAWSLEAWSEQIGRVLSPAWGRLHG